MLINVPSVKTWLTTATANPAITAFDPDHSEEEERFILLGMSFVLRVLVACHFYRAEDSIIRIISARKANELEVQAYSAYWS